MVKVKRGRFTKDTSCESIKTRSLQQYAETPKQKHAGGYTQRDMKLLTYLTDPQGIIKK